MDMNFVPSITDPPPTASKKSIFSFFTISTAFIKVSNLGLGSTPPNFKTFLPEIEFITLSKVPNFSTEPPP